jgi:uncharacterized protein YidB (DUF937 family)
MSLLSRIAVAAQLLARETALQDPLAATLETMLRGAPAMLAPPQLRPLLTVLVALQRAGFGARLRSWLGPGPRMPLPPEVLRQVLGEARVNQWARQAGMEPSAMVAELARVLPEAVSRMAVGAGAARRMLAAILRSRPTP